MTRTVGSWGATLGGVLSFVLILAGCEIYGPDAPTSQVHVLESFEYIQRLSAAEIRATELPIDIHYEVDLYRLVYETPSPDGIPVLASGLVAFPVDGPRAPLVSYQHGTEVLKAGVASVAVLDAGETLVAVAYAASGYVAAMPDYLGLGISAGLHPYVHSASLATSTIDMLRAARNLADELDQDLTGEVFLVGYSEGGNATAAAQRAIEADHSGEFDLVASAPMAGAYDLSGVMVEVMTADRPYPAPYYLPFQLLAFDEVYDLFDDLSDVFVAPLDNILPGLYLGTLDAGAINRQLPERPIQILVPEYLAAFDASPNHLLRQALRENDLYDWRPTTPTRLYHCVDDDLIPFENSVVAFNQFQANGAPDVGLEPLDFGGHADCAAPALLLSKLWFDSLRDL
ncbi:MAG: pimeloyl-ACP methyl ester carboxylesterase [Rhodothermales bacterium]|jgi:pimeloyl-ACP methyl ester carboxylesterase